MKKIIIWVGIILPVVGLGQSKFNQFKAQKHVLEGVKEYYQENFEEAVRKFNKAESLDPTNRDVFPFRGDALFQLEQYELALQDFGTAIQLIGNNADLFYRRGRVHERMGWYREAVADYEEALRIDRKHVKAQRQLTRVIRRENDPTYEDDYGYATGGTRTDQGDDKEFWSGETHFGDGRNNQDNGYNDGPVRDTDYGYNPDVLRRVRMFDGNRLFVRKAPKDMVIKRVELAEYTTRIVIEYSNVTNSYQQLYVDPPSTSKALYLTDMRLGKKYHLTNIYRDREHRGNFRSNRIAPGASLNFYLEFERIPDNMDVFQIRTGDEQNMNTWNFYGIILKK